MLDCSIYLTSFSSNVLDTAPVRSDQFQIIAFLALPCLETSARSNSEPKENTTRALALILPEPQTRNLNKQFGDFNFPPDGFSFFTEELRIKTFVSTFRNYFQNLENSNFLESFFGQIKILLHSYKYVRRRQDCHLSQIFWRKGNILDGRNI